MSVLEARRVLLRSGTVQIFVLYKPQQSRASHRCERPGEAHKEVSGLGGKE